MSLETRTEEAREQFEALRTRERELREAFRANPVDRRVGTVLVASDGTAWTVSRVALDTVTVRHDHGGGVIEQQDFPDVSGQVMLDDRVPRAIEWIGKAEE